MLVILSRESLNFKIFISNFKVSTGTFRTMLNIHSNMTRPPLTHALNIMSQEVCIQYGSGLVFHVQEAFSFQFKAWADII